MKNLQSIIKYLGSTRTRQKRTLAVTVILSVMVLFLVSILMTKPADSMSGQLICTIPEHTHNESCYSLICTQPEHICDENCQPQECTLAHECDESCLNTECSLIHECDETCKPQECPLIHECNETCPENCPLIHECDETCQSQECPLIHECDENCQPQECPLKHECDENCQPQECPLQHTHTSECYELVCQTDEHTHSQECYQEQETMFMPALNNTNQISIMADEEYFPSVPSSLPSNAMDVSGFIVNQPADDYPTSITIPDGIVDNNKIVDLCVSFMLPEEQIKTIINGSNATDKNFSNYLYFQLPEGVSFQTEKAGDSCIIRETVSGITYDTAYYALTNKIDGKSYIVFRVIDNYITEKFLNGAKKYFFKVEFSASVLRDSTKNNGERPITLRPDISDTVVFTEYKPNVGKYGERKSENGSNYIQWTITVNNKAPETKLVDQGYYITDTMLGNMIADSFSVTPEGAAEITTDSEGKKKIIFKNEASSENNYDIKITYRTPISKDLFYKNLESDRIIKNTGQLTNGTSTPLDFSSSVTVPPMGKISKWVASKDYQQASNPKINNEVFWEITLSTELNEQLAGYSITDEAFKAGMTDITVTDQNGNVISADSYTLTDGIITFKDNVTATSITVKYKASKDVTENTATVKYPSPYTEPGPSVTNYFNAAYKPYTLTKTGSYKDGKVTWTIKIDVNDSNITEIYGLVLNDDVFERMDGTPTIIARPNSWQETKNIDYDLSADKKSITFKKLAGSTDPAATSLELTFTANPSAAEQATLDRIEKTVFNNTATIKQNAYTDSISASVTYDPKNKIQKELLTKDTPTQFELNSSDSKTHPLSWSVTMVRDVGFLGDNKPYIDILQAWDNNTSAEHTQADHYITPTQQEETNIKIYAKVKEEDASWIPIENTDTTTYYTMRFFSDNQRENLLTSSDNARSFEIVFDPTNFVSANGETYTAIKIDYGTTGDLSKVDNIGSVSFKNKAEFDSLKTEQSTPPITVFDRAQVPYTKTPIDVKDWNNGQNLTPVTETQNLSNAVKTTENGIEYYVFGWMIEIDPNMISTELNLLDTFDDKFTLCTNHPYNPKLMWNSVWTNIYQDNVYENMSAVALADKDNWQTGFWYDSGNTPNSAYFQKIKSIHHFVYFTKTPVSEFKDIVLEKANNDETYLLDNAVDISNSTIPYNTITASIDLTATEEPVVTDIPSAIDKIYIPNEKGSDGTTDSGFNNIYYSVDINEDAKDLSNGDSIILKDSFLTNTYFDKSTNQTLSGSGLLNTVLNYVSVYEVDADGVEKELSTNDYTLQYNDNSYSDVSITPSKHKSWKDSYYGTGYYKWFHFGISETLNDASAYPEFTEGAPLAPGDVVTITLEYDADHVCNEQNIMLKFGGSGYYGQTVEKTISYNYDPITFNSDGTYSYTTVVPDGCTSVVVGHEAHGFKDINVEVTRRTNYSELGLVLPDAKHLRVKYSYLLLKDGVKPSQDSWVKFTNTATVIANTIISDTTNETQYTFKYDNTSASAVFRPRIKKYDVSDQSLTGLNAKFKFAKYNDGVWQWYSNDLASDGEISDSAWSSSENDAKVIQTVDGTFEFNGLISGGIYALQEVEEPLGSDYDYEDASLVPIYYFTYITEPDTYPPGIGNETLTADNVKKISSGSIIPVTNNRIIEVNVTKKWAEPQENATITAQLYWSYDKVIKGFPSKMFLAEKDDLNITDDTFDNTVEIITDYTWKNLPNGKNGKPIYYYVKEMGYTINGVSYATSAEASYYSGSIEQGKFLPFYVGNGVNSSEQRVEITNADALHIEKLWHDNQNNPLPSNYQPESIEFKLWGQETEDSEKVLIKNGESDTFTILKSENWVCKLDTSLIENYTIFDIEEVNVPDGYVVSYNFNYSGPTGIITMINKNPSIEVPLTNIIVEKTWHDGISQSRPSLNLTLKSSTDRSTWTNVNDVTPTEQKIDDMTVNYIYSDLPYRDSSGNVIYYKVSEDVPTGYICTESNNDGIDSGTIKLTNTKVISLNITKEWTDSYRQDHTGDTIEVTLYRSVLQSDAAKGNDSAYKHQTFTINQTQDNWNKLIQNLEAYDSDGKQYYYWIIENTANYPAYNPSYIYSGTLSDSISEDDGTVTITNNYIYPDVELPSTGGSGTLIYCILGAIIGLVGLAFTINFWQIKTKKH